MEGNERIFQYRFLPKPVRDFFLDSGLDDIELIAKSHGLSQEAIDELDTIQQEVLFGYEPIDKIPNLLKVRMGYDDALAKQVTLDLIEKRFLPLDSYLQATAFRLFAQLGGNITVVNIKRIDNVTFNVSQVRRSVDEFAQERRAAELAAKTAEAAKPAVEVTAKPVVEDPARPVGEIAAKTAPQPKPVPKPESIPKPEPAKEPEPKPEPAPQKKTEPQPKPEPRPAPKKVEAPKAVPETKQPPAPPVKPKPRLKQKPQKKTGPKPPAQVNVNIAPKPDPLKKALKEMDKAMDSDGEELKGESAIDTGLVSGALDPSHELAPPPPMVVEAPRPTEGRKGRRLKRRSAAQPIKSDTPRVKESPKAERPKPKPVEEAPLKPIEPLATLNSSANVEVKEPVQEKTVKMAPRPASAKASKPVPKGSILDVAHEAEIANIVNELKESGDNAPRALNHPKIDEVQRKLSLTFPSSEIQKRFRVLVGSRLSGVRTIEDFRLALARPVSKGGLALDEHTADRVIELIEGHKVKVSSSAKKQTDQGKRDYVKERTKKYEQAPKISKSTNSEVKPVRGISASSKGPVTDVKRPRRLIGPIDELRQMNVDDFRRMPGSIADAVENIKDDIVQIGQHDPGRHIKAIEAWRSSPLVRYYQVILSRTLQSGVPVKATLGDSASNPKKLSIDEFEAIRNLNATLRY